jgi:hypothetical protein
MLRANVERVTAMLSDSDIVVDIGGWAQPFNRATHIVDIMPYATRGVFGNVGGGKEWYSEQTWIVHDVSGRGPLPFENKSVDFVICSHVLEDIRDPMFLCSEMIRIGKRGYIEVPSRLIESVRGLEGKNYAGYYHHRWLIEREENGLIFRHKPHLLHNSRKYYLPNLMLRSLEETQRVTWLFWEEEFHHGEAIQLSSRKVADELEEFVREQHAPLWWYWADPVWLQTKNIVRWLLKRPKSDEEQFWSRAPEIFSR